MRVVRVGDGPIIGPDSDPSIGTNIQGPSVIEVPDWVESPLGRFYCYFADHEGTYIRLAYADRPEGPWTVHPPGGLQLADSGFLTEPPAATEEELEGLRRWYKKFRRSAGPGYPSSYEPTPPHVASPDVHVDHASQRIVMYFHGLDGLEFQLTRAAVSTDGLHFESRAQVLGPPYFRAFRHQAAVYALSMPGKFLRSTDGLAAFEAGPTLFEPTMRHAAVVARDGVLHVLWTRVGDAPEAILHTPIDLAADWADWRVGPTVEVLRPYHDWEGADAPLEPSIRGAARGHVNQLRDPAILDQGDELWLYYAIAGESGIGVARLEL